LAANSELSGANSVQESIQISGNNWGRY